MSHSHHNVNTAQDQAYFESKGVDTPEKKALINSLLRLTSISGVKIFIFNTLESHDDNPIAKLDSYYRKLLDTLEGQKAFITAYICMQRNLFPEVGETFHQGHREFYESIVKHEGLRKEFLKRVIYGLNDYQSINTKAVGHLAPLDGGTSNTYNYPISVSDAEFYINEAVISGALDSISQEPGNNTAYYMARCLMRSTVDNKLSIIERSDFSNYPFGSCLKLLTYIDFEKVKYKVFERWKTGGEKSQNEHTIIIKTLDQLRSNTNIKQRLLNIIPKNSDSISFRDQFEVVLEYAPLLGDEFIQDYVGELNKLENKEKASSGLAIVLSSNHERVKTKIISYDTNNQKFKFTPKKKKKNKK